MNRLLVTLVAGMGISGLLSPAISTQKDKAPEGYLLAVRVSAPKTKPAGNHPMGAARKDVGGKTLPTLYPSDKEYFLYGGFRIKPFGGAIVRIRRVNKVGTPLKQNEWYPVQPLPDHVFVGLNRSTLGRKGSNGLLYPVAESTILPRKICLIWKPVQGHCTIKVTEDIEHGKVLWAQTDVDTSTGLLRSEKLQNVLDGWRAIPKEGWLRASLQDEDGKELMFSRFRVMHATEEFNMNQELDETATYPWLARLVAEGGIYRKRKMPYESAIQYTTALQSAPNNRLLKDLCEQALHDCPDFNLTDKQFDKAP